MQFERKNSRLVWGKIRKNFTKEEGDLWVGSNKTGRTSLRKDREKAFQENKIKTKVAASW